MAYYVLALDVVKLEVVKNVVRHWPHRVVEQTSMEKTKAMAD